MLFDASVRHACYDDAWDGYFLDLYEKFVYTNRQREDCGMSDEKDSISITSEFVKGIGKSVNGPYDGLPEYEEISYGTGFVFLWAKLRFGIFEEYGVGENGKGRSTAYPMWYLKRLSNSDFKFLPNVCIHTLNDDGSGPILPYNTK